MLNTHKPRGNPVPADQLRYRRREGQLSLFPWRYRGGKEAMRSHVEVNDLLGLVPRCCLLQAVFKILRQPWFG